MADIINLRVYTPDRLFLDETILKLSIRGKEGAFTILPRHIDYVSSFGDGILYYTDLDNQRKYMAVNQGILIKCGREIQISLFHSAVGDSLEELVNKIKELAEKSKELIETDKKLNTSLKNIEYFIYEKLTRFRKYA